MQIVSKSESVTIQFNNTLEQIDVERRYECEGWDIVNRYSKNDKPLTEFRKVVSQVVPLTVMDAVEGSDCELLTIRYDGQLLFYGRRENFIAGIENSLQYRRLSRRYILSTTFDGDVLQLQVDLTSKEC